MNGSVDLNYFRLNVLEQIDFGKEKRKCIVQDGIDKEDAESAGNCLEANGEGEQVGTRQCHWVQCDNPDCHKWRRIDYITDINSLSTEPWTCGMNEGST